MATQNDKNVQTESTNTANTALEAENEALKAEIAALKAKTAATGAESSPITGIRKMVKIKLPKTREQKEDVFVSVNMHTFQIQRGVDVEVPDYVYEVLQHQEEMLEQIAIFEEQARNKNK